MKLPKQPVLEGERIFLRKVKISDAEEEASLLNDFKVVEHLGLHIKNPYPFKVKYAKKYIQEVSRKKDKYMFMIVLKDTGRIIGAMGIEGFEKKTDYQIAKIGYWIGKEYWGKGYAKEAVSLVIDFAFKKLKLRKICAQVNEPNIASQKLLEKLGFKKEGILREHVKYQFGDGWLNEICYGLLKREWKK